MKRPNIAWVACLVISALACSCKARKPWAAYMRRAITLLDAKPAEAIHEFERAGKAGADAIEVKKGLGIAHKRLKEYDEARRLLHEVITKKPDDVESRLEIASIDVMQKRLDEARTELEPTLKHEPPHVPSLLLFAALARTPSQGKAGLESLSRLHKTQFAPLFDSAEYAFARASLQAATGDAVAAEVTLAGASGFDSINPTLAIGLAEVSRAGNRARFAEWLLSRASNTRTATDAVHMALAELAMSQRHLALASGAISKLQTYVKPDRKALLLQADLYDLKNDQAERSKVLLKALDMIPKEDLAERRKVEMEYAIALQHSGKTKQSESAVTDLLARNPGFPPAQILLAKLRLAQKRPDEAIQRADAATKNEPMRTEAYQLLVSAYLMKNAPTDAEAVARRYVASSSSSPDSVALLANLLISEKHLDAALREVEAGLARHPNQLQLVTSRITLTERVKGFAKAEAVALDATRTKNPFIQRELAHLYERNKRIDQAINVLREVAAADPSALIELSAMEAQAGQLTNAISSIRKLADVDPYDIDALLRLGMLEERAGHADNAKQAYEKTLVIAPDSIVALNNLATLLSVTTGEAKRAVDLARKAAVLSHGDPRIADTLGWALVQNKNPSDRVEAIRVLAGSSDGLRTPESYYHYGVALAADGRFEQAKAALDSALSAKDSFSWRSGAEKVLSTVRGRLAETRQ